MLWFEACKQADDICRGVAKWAVSSGKLDAVCDVVCVCVCVCVCVAGWLADWLIACLTDSLMLSEKHNSTCAKATGIFFQYWVLLQPAMPFWHTTVCTVYTLWTSLHFPQLVPNVDLCVVPSTISADVMFITKIIIIFCNDWSDRRGVIHCTV